MKKTKLCLACKWLIPLTKATLGSYVYFIDPYCKNPDAEDAIGKRLFIERPDKYGCIYYEPKEAK